MKDNLSIAGSEIVNGNNNISIRTSFTPVKNDQKIIIKSYNLINTPKKETIKNNNKYTEKNSSETKRGYSLDLSKIKYNDGYIFTDAVNSNPGFGLWAIKGSSYNETNQSSINTSTKTNKSLTNKRLLIKENKINNNRYNQNNLTKSAKKPSINNISTIKNINNISNNNITTNNNKSLNNSNNVNDTNNIEKKKQNRKIIDQLTMKCNDLEQKCLNVMSNYKQKEFLCNNEIKIKNEYEKILQENIEETKLIKEEYKKISLDNNKLNNVYKNTKNELDRLLNVMRTDNNNIKKLREEFENRLKNEEIERSRLNNVLKINEKEIESLRRDIYGENQNENIRKKKQKSNTINNIMAKSKNSSKKKDFEIDNLNDIILELEIKVSNLKKKIAKTDQENDKLRTLLRFKEQKDEIEKNNITNLYHLLEYKTKNQQNELNTINEQNLIINNLKNNKDYIKRRNKLAKSMSLKKVKIYNKLS